MNLFRLFNRKSLINNSIILIVLLNLVISLDGKTQEVYDLTRCITEGLENNLSLKVVKTREEISDNNYTKGNAGFLPTINNVNRYGGNLNNTTQTSRDESKNTSNGIYNSSATANVNLDWMLFNGFKVQTTWQKLAELKQVGELNTRMEMENLVSKIIAQYYLYVQQLNYSKNLAYAVELSRERVRIDEQRYLLGASSKLELLQSMVYLNADSSVYAKQRQNLLISQVNLKKLMSLENLEQEIFVGDSTIQINYDLIYEKLLELTLQQNTSLLIASKDKTISELDYKIIASQALPYLNLSSGYTYSLNNYGSGTTRQQQVNGFNYGLTLGVNIFDGFERKREKSNAKIAIESVDLQYREIEQDIKANLINIYYAYQNNLQLLKLEEQNLEVARENLGIAMERYKLGNLSGIDLREVQKSLLDAEERLISAQYLTKTAEISLLQISGQVMNYLN